MNVSVVLASFNGKKYIEQQIESIIHQLDKDDELIISDDHSTDCTLDILKKYDELPNVTILMNQGIGFLDNFTTAIKHTKNDIIIFSDQDDVWLDGRILKVKEFFYKGATLVVLKSKYVDENLSPLNYDDSRIIKWRRGFFTNLIKNTYSGAHIAVNKNFLEITMPFPKQVKYHDLWIALLAEFYKQQIEYSNEEFTLYRRHSNNVTGKKNNLIEISKNRLILIYTLFSKIIFIKRRGLL